MKKASKFLVVALLVMSAFMMMGCNLLNMLEEIIGPQKQWRSYCYEYKYTPKDEEGNATGDTKTVYLDLYLMYSDTDVVVNNITKNTVTGESSTLPAGLNIVVIPTIKTKNNKTNNTDDLKELLKVDITGDLNNYYIIKNFPKGEEIDIDGAEAEENPNKKGSFHMNQTAWTLIYNSIVTTKSTVPGEIIEDNRYEREELHVDDVFWKKILYGLAINKLIELSQQTE